MRQKEKIEIKREKRSYGRGVGGKWEIRQVGMRGCCCEHSYRVSVMLVINLLPMSFFVKFVGDMRFGVFSRPHLMVLSRFCSFRMIFFTCGAEIKLIR